MNGGLKITTTEVFTPKEASKEFFNGTISYWKLLDMAKSGEIPYKKARGRYLFYRKALEEWMTNTLGNIDTKITKGGSNNGWIDRKKA